MRPHVGMVLAVAAAIAAAGCGGGGGGGTSTSSTDTGTISDAKSVVAAAPEKVKDATSSKVRFAITVDSDQLSSPITIPGSGEFDYAAKGGRLTMDYGDVLEAAGQSASGDMEILNKGSVYYVKWPLFSKLVKASTPWISFDITKLDDISGIDTTSLRSVNQGDPSQTLVYLKAAGSVEELGKEDVDGVPTTKYHAEIDLDRIADLAPADQRDSAVASVKSLKETYGIDKLPMDVWLDDRGLPHKLAYEIATTVQGAKVRSALSMTLSDYGVDVDLAPPPASQVTDLASLS